VRVAALVLLVGLALDAEVPVATREVELKLVAVEETLLLVEPIVDDEEAFAAAEDDIEIPLFPGKMFPTGVTAPSGFSLSALEYADVPLNSDTEIVCHPLAFMTG
jgi:hypothetical protein